MKIYLTLLLLLFVNFENPNKKLSPKQQRILIEKSLDNSEKQIIELTKIVENKEKLKK